MLNSVEHTDPNLAAVFSKWYTGAAVHRMHFESSYTKINANSGVDQRCPLSTCGFSAAIDRVLRFVLADLCRILDDGAKLCAYLDDWYLWTRPQCLTDALVLITAATRSVNLELPPSKIQVWRASCGDPIPQAFLNKVKPILNRLGGHLHIQGDSEPSPLVLGGQATMEKATQRFRATASTFAEINAEGPCTQTVNDLLTRYVGAASQHVLRMSFVPGTRSQVNRHRSHRILVASHQTRRFFSLVPLAFQAWWTWLWFRCTAPRGCSMAGMAIGDSHTHLQQLNHQDTDTLLTPHATASRSTCLTSNRSLTTEEEATWPSAPTPPRRGLSPTSKSTSTNNSSRTTPHPQSVKPPSSLSLCPTLVPTLCNATARPTRLKTVVFACPLPGDSCCRTLQPQTPQALC